MRPLLFYLFVIVLPAMFILLQSETVRRQMKRKTKPASKPIVPTKDPLEVTWNACQHKVVLTDYCPRCFTTHPSDSAVVRSILGGQPDPEVDAIVDRIVSGNGSVREIHSPRCECGKCNAPPTPDELLRQGDETLRRIQDLSGGES